VSRVLEHIFEQINSERKVCLEPIRTADLYLCIASLAGMTDPHKIVLLSALYDCASRIGDLSGQTLPDWKGVFTNVTLVDVAEPECALWEQLEGSLLENHRQRYQVIDIGDFATLCEQITCKRPVSNFTIVRLDLFDPSFRARHLL
jgi:hypothetical protein